MTIRAHFDGKVFDPVDRIDLPKDQLVEIEVLKKLEPEKGSPQAVLRLMDRFASASPEAIDALELAIEQSKLPPRQGGVFDSEVD
jgi:hypothetical protein